MVFLEDQFCLKPDRSTVQLSLTPTIGGNDKVREIMIWFCLMQGKRNCDMVLFILNKIYYWLSGKLNVFGENIIIDMHIEVKIHGFHATVGEERCTTHGFRIWSNSN